MRSRKIKKIAQMKKGHGWLSLFVYLIIFAFAGALLTYALYYLMNYVVHTKLIAEYETISYMASIYDKSLEDGTDVTDLLEEAGKEYIIRTASGELLYGDADNTCRLNGTKTVLSGLSERVTLFTDGKYPLISTSKKGRLELDVAGIILELSRIDEDNSVYNEDLITIDKGDTYEVYESFDLFFSMSSNVEMKLPIWMGVEVNGGKDFLIGKAYLTLRVSDLITFSIVIIAIAVLFLIIFFMFIAIMIGNIKHRNRARKMLFMDLATGGKNRTWFEYTGDGMLRRFSNASATYALVNLVFVKYNTFCVCHSVSEAEPVIRSISDCIGQHIHRREIHAHGAPEEFMILFRVKDMDELNSRLGGLIADLENIDKDHAFTYQAGVSVLPPVRNKNGRIVRRKYIDIEEEYNNACTARSTLGNKEESGIAYFDVRLIEERKWQDQVEERCRAALEREEFKVYYQSKYDPDTGIHMGAEALIRWQSPEFGLVPPGKFIPIFEKNGFITNIDHYMLSHVAADQKRWLDAGFKCVPVSVNVSRAHFIETDLAEQIRDIVDKSGCPRNLVEIELTESAFFDDKNMLIKTIDRLREYGFAVSMDDFGSGYSSLNSLKDMPLDVLKLDAEFFRGQNAGERGRVIVAETIKLAKMLNMRTVAEGIEDKETVEFLKSLGCDMIQGYYYAKPMPGGDYEERMKQGKYTGNADETASGAAQEATAETPAEKPETVSEPASAESQEPSPETPSEEMPVSDNHDIQN